MKKFPRKEKKSRRFEVEEIHDTAIKRHVTTTPRIIADITIYSPLKKNAVSSQLLTTGHSLPGNHSHAYATTTLPLIDSPNSGLCPPQGESRGFFCFSENPHRKLTSAFEAT